jgi:P27 family predicted phage terminase small subunit
MKREQTMHGPPPLPTKLKLLRGNPGRRKLHDDLEPASAPQCPAPPDHLSRHAAAEWRRVAPELHQLGLLSVLDEASFACYCSAYGLWRQAEEALAEGFITAPGSEKNTVVNPLLKIATQAARDTIRFGNEFGLSPASRSRVAMRAASAPSKFEGLLGGSDGWRDQ